MAVQDRLLPEVILENRRRARSAGLLTARCSAEAVAECRWNVLSSRQFARISSLELLVVSRTGSGAVAVVICN